MSAGTDSEQTLTSNCGQTGVAWRRGIALALVAAVGVACDKVLAEDFKGYARPSCEGVACSGSSGTIGGVPNDEIGVGGSVVDSSGRTPSRQSNDVTEYVAHGGAGGHGPIGGVLHSDSAGYSGEVPHDDANGGVGGEAADNLEAGSAGTTGVCDDSEDPDLQARVVAYGVGAFSGGGTGLFRSTASTSDSAINQIGGGVVDVLSSDGKTFHFAKWWNLPFYGRYGTLAADLDNDGQADLVALGNSYVGVIKATRCGFGEFEYWSYSPFNGQYGNFVGDIDGDGRADLVGLGYGYIGALRSMGAAFRSYEETEIPPYSGTYGNFLADVDGDKKADVICLADHSVGVFRSAGRPCPPGTTCEEGTFLQLETWDSETFNGTYGSAVGDVNGDGYADIVTFDYQRVEVGLSNGTNAFSSTEWSSDTIVGSTPALLADVNNDGKADVVLLTSSKVTVRLSSPVGRGAIGTHFGPEQTWFSKPF